MDLLETTPDLQSVSIQTAAASLAAANHPGARDRIVSLDAMRGFAVIGMIVVNTIAFSSDSHGSAPVSRFVSHSAWAGFTFADFVFPAFIFLAGFSVAVSLRHASFEWPVVRRIATRAILLCTLGFVLANLARFFEPGNWRYLGVLQRIGLCYLATALLYLASGTRARLVIALALLAVYWPLVALPVPHQTTNLLVPGTNFVSWLDRLVLGSHALVTGAHGYDPEGVLSTLPAVAQCLLGAAFGEWFMKTRGTDAALPRLTAAGAASLLLGLCWSPFFPVVKNIWTGSFVFVSSGLSALLFCALYWALDRKKFHVPGAAFLQAFGANALFAYIVQELAQLLPAGGEMHAIGTAGARMDMPSVMAAVPVVAFLLILWAPLAVMRRRRWYVRL